jgi:hypothetical protein
MFHQPNHWRKAMSKGNFDPIRGSRGEFRVAMNISELGDRAFELLAFSQELGFDKPKFATHTRHSGVTEIWAIVLQQFHDYYANSTPVIDPWDTQIDELRMAIGEGNEFNLITLFNFAEYLEPMEATA